MRVIQHKMYGRRTTVSPEIIGLMASLVGLYDKVVRVAREKHQAREAAEIAERVRAEIALLVYECFGNDSQRVVEDVISNPIVADAIIDGEPADRLYKVFKEAYQDSDGQFTGGPVLDERVAQFTDRAAGILLRFDLNPAKALGNKLDATRRDLGAGFSEGQRGMERLSDLIDARTDPFQGARAQIGLTQGVLGQGKLNATKANAQYLLTQGDYSSLPPELQHHIQSLLSSASMYAGEIDAALSSFETTLAEAPDNLSLMHNTATVNLLAGQLDRAEELTTRLLEAQPRDGSAMGVLIQTTYAKYGLDSVRELKRANAWISANATATGALTMVYANEGLFQEAEELLRPHVPAQITSFHDVQLVTQLATALSSLASEELKQKLPLPGQLPASAEGLLREAEATYSQALDWLWTTDHNDVLATTLSNRSVVRMLLSNNDAAIEDVETGFKIDPDNKHLRSQVTRFELIRGRPDAVIERLKKVPTNERLPGESGVLGKAYLIKGQYPEAVAALELELSEAKEPMHRIATCTALLTAYAAANDDEGVRKIRTVIDQEADDDPTALAAIANVLWDKGETREAHSYFSRAVNAGNERGKDIARLNYADVLMQSGQWAMAAEQLSEVAANSDDEMVHRNLAVSLFRQGDYARAFEIADSYAIGHRCTLDTEELRDVAKILLSR